MNATTHERARASSSTSRTAPLDTSPSIAFIAPGSRRRSHAASVRTGQQVRSGDRRLLSVTTHRTWASSWSRTMATKGPVSTTARLLTSKAFHVSRIGGEVCRTTWSCFEAADEPGPAQDVKGGLFRPLVAMGPVGSCGNSEVIEHGHADPMPSKLLAPSGHLFPGPFDDFLFHGG